MNTFPSLVSNTSETASSNASNSFAAQAFTTGANTGGYTLGEVIIRLASDSVTTATADVVKIFDVDSGTPNDEVATLTHPASLTAGALNTFTAPADTVLAASTTYYVVINDGVSSANRVKYGRTEANDETGETGWSIADTRQWRSDPGDSWGSADDEAVIDVRGIAVTGSTSTDATLSALSLGSGVTLSPTFASDTTAYRAWVANSVSSVTATATKNDANATVAITGDSDTLTPNTATLSLEAGANTVEVTVTAEDDNTTETYTVTVVREAAAPTADPNALLTANLTAGQEPSVDVFGYSFSGTDRYGAWTGTSFQFGGATLEVRSIEVRLTTLSRPNRITVCFESDPGTAVNPLTLDVGGREFALADATKTFSCFRWDRPTDFTWDYGEVVLVKITGDDRAPALAAVRDPWSATLTVAELTTPGHGLFGYGFYSGVGSLTSETFTHPEGGTNYTVERLWITAASNSPLRIRLNPPGETVFDSSAFSLHVAGTEFLFDDATFNGNSDRRDFEWANTTLSWSADDEIAISLSHTPEVSSVNGMALVLRYDEALDETSEPAASAYTVMAAGSSVTVSDVEVSGSAVTLTLATAVTHGQTVTVSYAVPGSNPLQDTTGNDAAALSNAAIANDTLLPPDTTAPLLDGAPTVNGTTLVIAYNEALDTTSVPATSAYTVTVAGSGRTVSDVAVSGSTVTLTLSSAVTSGQAVMLAYAVPGTNPVRDEAENNAAAIGTRSVTNVTGDTTAPILDGNPTVDGATLVIAYNEALDPNSRPAASAYTVTVAGSGRTVSTVAVSGSAVTLTLSSAVTPGQPVILAYAVPGTNPVQDAVGNDAAAFANATVTNNTTDTTAPILDGNPTVDGVTLVIAYNEALDTNSRPAASAYTVTVAGSGRTVSAVGVSGSAVTLTLSSAVTAGQTVILAYAKPGTNPVQDTSGNDAAAFSNRTVTNNTTDTTAPTLTGNPTVDGAALVIAYNKALDMNSRPAASAYTVRVAGAPRSVSTVGVSGSAVTLTLSPAVTAGQAVRLTYAKPATNPVQDTNGNDAAGFSDRTVDNNTAPPPTACNAPDLTGRKVLWTAELTIANPLSGEDNEYGFWIGPPAEGALSDTTVETGTDSYVVDGVWWRLRGSGQLSIIVTTPLGSTDKETLVLHVCDDGFALRDSREDLEVGYNEYFWRDPGLDWRSETRRTLRMSVSDTSAPSLDGRPTVHAAELRLIYDEPLDEDSTPGTSAFTVRADGSPVAATGVTVRGDRVTLDLASAVLPEQTVTLSYAPPGLDPLQDEAGNKAVALTNEAVDNRTTDAVQGDLRLEDGPTESEGRLEIFAVDPNAGADERPRWGTVCDDRFTSWSRPRGGGPAEPNRASFVACRILGYEGGEFVSGHDIFSHDSLEETPIWLDDVRCLAGDPAHKAGDGDSPVSLLDCYHAGLARHNCAHAEDVAVRCTGTLGDPPNQGPGLTFGAVDTDGRGVVLTFDEPLDADRPPATGAFVVSGDGVLNAVTAVDAPGTGGLGANELRLGVERVIEPGERVDVIYSDPSDGDDDAAIQDESGVDGPSFHRKVANERVAGGQNPGGGQNNPVEGPVTASFTDVPAAHDGETGIAPRIALDAALSTSWTGVRDALAVTGGVLTRVQRVDGRSDLWSVQVTPSGAADLTVRLNASPACGDPATTMCTADGRRVETAIETTVPGPEEAVDETPLTVSIADMPAEHGGADAVFAFRLTFSETLASSYSYETMRDHSLGVWQGRHLRATNARRLEPPGNRYWEITITPINAQDLAISLGPTFECTDTGAMCTDDGRKLSNAFTRLVRGPTPNGIVGGDALSMIWPSPRDGFGSPAATDFAVRVDGAPRAVTAAALAGRTAMLLLAAPVSAENVVTVGYLGSAMHPLADASGIVRSAPWFDLAVENVTGTDTPVAAPDAEQRPDDPLAAAADGTRVLDASGLGLTDLAGLARLAALARLDLSGNAVADLAPLAGLTALRDLDLSGNRVADLGPLSALHGLERLDLSRNAVTDLSPLAGLPRLAVLVLDGNAVADLGPLTHLGRLEQLGLAGNAVVDVTPLQDLPTLRRLDLSGNAVGDLSPLGDVGALVWLALPGEAVAAAPALGRLTGLRWVWLDRGGADDARAPPGTLDGRR